MGKRYVKENEKNKTRDPGVNRECLYKNVREAVAEIGVNVVGWFCHWDIGSLCCEVALYIHLQARAYYIHPISRHNTVRSGRKFGGHCVVSRYRVDIISLEAAQKHKLVDAVRAAFRPGLRPGAHLLRSRGLRITQAAMKKLALLLLAFVMTLKPPFLLGSSFPSFSVGN